MEDDHQNSKWHVLYTKPRHEIKALERLVQNGFEVYCPMKTTLKQWSDRKKKKHSTLITLLLIYKNNRKKTRNPSYRPLSIKLYILVRQTGNC